MKAVVAMLAAAMVSTPAGAGEHAPWGLDYALPDGWSAVPETKTVRLTTGDADVRVTLIDAGRARTAIAALHSVHTLPATAPTLLPAAPGGGWSARVEAAYRLPPSTHRVVRAVALHGPAGWSVMTIDAASADAESHAADLAVVESSLHPSGWHPERIAGPARPMTPARVAALRAFVAEGMRRLGVPGAGLAVIDHGRIVFEGGIGVRTIGQSAQVTAHTRFMIASNTKGLTTLLLARLVDEGRLDWDAAATRAWPDFRVGDAALTARLRLRDLVCACTGLPRADLPWIFNTPAGTAAADTFTKLALTMPTTPFGARYQYNNLIVAAAGFVAGHALYPTMDPGAAYDRAMREKILGPLGMDDTSFDFDAALAGNHASPHADTIDGRVVRAGDDLNRATMPYRPSGGAWSSAHDMIRYVAQELTPGVSLTGNRVVSAANALERRRPGVIAGGTTRYGMGLRIDDVGGVTVIHHGGSQLGYQSDWCALPDAGIGAVLLMNADSGNALREPFMRQLLELVYGAQPLARAQLAAAAARRVIRARADAARVVTPTPPAAMSALAQDYVEPSLGRLAVERRDGKVRFRFATLSTEIAVRHEADGSTAFVASDPGMADFVFTPGTADGARTLTIRDGQHAYIFVERR